MCALSRLPAESETIEFKDCLRRPISDCYCSVHTLGSVGKNLPSRLAIQDPDAEEIEHTRRGAILSASVVVVGQQFLPDYPTVSTALGAIPRPGQDRVQ